MGFRRLSIQDLSPSGHQPMVFGEGRYVLMFNGEIYNHRDLRMKHLPGLPHQSSGDTEVLGQMLERLPLEQVLEELRGMFAFIWYDRHTKSVIAARDRFGIKPLFYHGGAQKLYISSEIRSLLHLDIGRELCNSGLGDYLATGSVQAPHSILKDVACLPPGHLIRWTKDSGAAITGWYQAQWKPATAWIKGGMDEWREHVRQTILGSIQAHLVSDVEVGVFLSGGLDSSLLACAMTHLGHNKIKAFSIGYEQGAGVPDESGIAAKTAQHLGAKYECDVISSAQIHGHFDQYIQAVDQPTGDALNTYLAARVASRSVKVALSGVGVDEWFGGYTYHRALQSARSMGLMHPALRGAMPLMERLLGEEGLGRFHPALRKISQLSRLLKGHNIIGIQNNARQFFTYSELRDASLFNHAAKWEPAISLRELERMAPGSLRNQLLALEHHTFLQNTLLRDADWASMAHSLEVRTPYVDAAVFDLAAMLPPDAKFTASQGKRVIRECFTDILPPWILEDRQKKTFTLPKTRWMQEPVWKEHIQDVLRSERFRSRGFISPPAIEQTLRNFYQTRDHTPPSFIASQKVWLLFVLEKWLRTHIDDSN